MCFVYANVITINNSVLSVMFVQCLNLNLGVKICHRITLGTVAFYFGHHKMTNNQVVVYIDKGGLKLSRYGN